MVCFWYNIYGMFLNLSAFPHALLWKIFVMEKRHVTCERNRPKIFWKNSFLQRISHVTSPQLSWKMNVFIVLNLSLSVKILLKNTQYFCSFSKKLQNFREKFVKIIGHTNIPAILFQNIPLQNANCNSHISNFKCFFSW